MTEGTSAEQENPTNPSAGASAQTPDFPAPSKSASTCHFMRTRRSAIIIALFDFAHMEDKVGNSSIKADAYSGKGIIANR